MRRRDLLVRLGAGAAGIAFAPGLLRATAALRPDRLADLAERIRRTPHDRIFALAVDAIRAGADTAALLGATFLAGVHDVRPRPVGGNLHSVMLVEASYRLVERAAGPTAAWLVTLWTLDAFKRTQMEEDGESWVLDPAPDVEFADEASARKALLDALDAWDEAAVDRAIVGLLPFHDRESVYEVLWPSIARCMAYLGHKIVYGAMTEAVLRRIDWRYAQPTLRSLVLGLVGGGHSPKRTRSFDSAVGRADALPAGWMEGKEDPAQSAVLLARLLAGSYEDAQKAVIAAFADGLGPRTVWDAIRLAAAELFLRRTSDDPLSGAGIRSVHAVTELWSMARAWRTTKLERNRRLLMLQAAGWIPELRDALVEREAISMQGPGIVSLGSGVGDVPTSVAALLEANDPAAARVLLDRSPGRAGAFLAALQHDVAAKGVEYHQFKYAIALEDELPETALRWRSRLLAPALRYMPTPAAADAGLTARSLAALRQAGIVD